MIRPVLSDAEDPRDVLVIESGGRSPLLVEPRDDLGVIGLIRRQQLERDLTVKPGLMPVGPLKRFDELMICGKPLRRVQSRVQIWPPVAGSSVTLTIIGTWSSAEVGSGAPIRRASWARHRPARLMRVVRISPV